MSSLVDSLCRAKAYFCTTTRYETIRQQLRVRFIEEEVSKWHVIHGVSQFDRRLTCIEWHKEYPHMVAFGSYAGDVYLLDTAENKNNHFIQGVGYGYGAVTAMGFCPGHSLFMYIASLDGTFSVRDFRGYREDILETSDLRYWWTSFDSLKDVMFVGGNTGRAVLIGTADRNTIFEYDRLHKGKIQFAQFCPSSNNILATSSNDKTVALWDIRTWGESVEPHPFAVLQHDAPINSAYFDPIYGSRLLTTTQNSKLCVFDAHNWETPSLTMTHPHRNFQHITHIKATWHPFYEDLCVIGRYAEANDPDKTRCVDLIDLKKGKVAAQFYDPNASQIMTVNKFNQFGDMLASGMGSNALIWSMNRQSCDKYNNKMIPSSNCISLPHGHTSTQRRERRKRKRSSDDKLDVKVKTKKSVKMKLK